MKPIGLLLDTCGLSTHEAANFLNLPHGVVKSWVSGREPAPPQIVAELRWLYRRIVESAELQLAEIRLGLSEFSEHGKPPVVDIKMPTNDKEAQEMGMPCVGVCRVRAGILIALLDTPVILIS